MSDEKSFSVWLKNVPAFSCSSPYELLSAYKRSCFGMYPLLFHSCYAFVRKSKTNRVFAVQEVSSALHLQLILQLRKFAFIVEVADFPRHVVGIFSKS